MVGPRPRVLLTPPLTVAHRTNPEHTMAFSNDRFCDTLSRWKGGFRSLNGKQMSCKNEPYRHERKARNCFGRATEEVNFPRMEYYCQLHLSEYSDSLEARPYVVCLLGDARDLLAIQNIRPALGTSGLLFSGCCGSFPSVEAADA
jgi:hypothetical protein